MSTAERLNATESSLWFFLVESLHLKLKNFLESEHIRTEELSSRNSFRRSLCVKQEKAQMFVEFSFICQMLWYSATSVYKRIILLFIARDSQGEAFQGWKSRCFLQVTSVIKLSFWGRRLSFVTFNTSSSRIPVLCFKLLRSRILLFIRGWAAALLFWRSFFPFTIQQA